MWVRPLPRIAADPVVDWTPGGEPSAAWDEERLSALLGYAAGASAVEFGPQSGWRHHRMVPSARCLSPCSVWSLGPDGAARYSPEHHQLWRTDTGHPDPHRPAGLAITAAVGVTGAHYRDYAYRLVCQEAGLHLGSILLTARSLGLACEIDTEHRPVDLDEMLGLDGRHEIALLLLRIRGIHTDLQFTAAPAAVPALVRPCESLAECGELSAATHHRYALTAFPPGARAPSEPAGVRHTPPGTHWRAVRTARDSGDPGFTPSPRPVHHSVLRDLAAAAWTTAFPRIWADTPPILVLTAVVHADGLRPGLYRNDPGDRMARLPVEVSSFLHRTQMLPSTNAHLAPATFLLVTDTALWLRTRGDRSYTDLHLRAGEAAQRLLVAASGAGLTARIHNGFLTGPVRGLHPTGSWVAPFAVMISHRRPSARYRFPVDADR